MKKCLIISALIFIQFSCTKERKPETFTFDASKDTSFVLTRSSSQPISIVYSIKGQIGGNTELVISYYKVKVDSKLKISLDSGLVNIKDRRHDFYQDKALFTFKHLNNKKRTVINNSRSVTACFEIPKKPDFVLEVRLFWYLLNLSI